MNRTGRLRASTNVVPAVSVLPARRATRATAFSLAVVLALLLSACGEPGTESAAPPGEAAGLSTSTVPTSPGLTSGMTRKALLPAHKTDAEMRRAAAKADWIDDWRNAHPEWYAITAPPALANVRPMVEWEPMQANTIAYVDYLAQDPDVRDTLVDIAAGTLDYADVWVIYQSDAMRTDLVNRLQAKGYSSRTIEDRTTFFQIDNDSVWLIDFGPLPLVDEDTNTVAFLDWRYYTDTDRVLDDAVPSRLGEMVGATVYRQPFDIEGGNFQAGTNGVCYTTERAFYWTGEQPATLEMQLQYYAGCEELVVLRDIHDDGTGHIDMFFKLVSDDVAIIGDYAPGQDSQADADMDWNATLLEGRGMTVYRMPMPSKGVYNSGWSLEYIPRTYLNSTFVNGPRGKVNLWPVYGDDQDIQAEAQAVWEAAMPEWDHVGVRADEIALMSGTIHCVTRTIPDLPFTKWVDDGTCSGGRCTAPAGGYAGNCGSSDDCYGPAWLCANNSCVFAPDDPCSVDADCAADAGECQVAACLNGICQYTSECAAGESCFLDTCVAGCGGLPFEGCCASGVAYYCDTQNNAIVRDDCQALYGVSICSWIGEDGYYCSETDTGADPSGVLPLECSAYLATPQCATDEDCAVDTLCANGVCTDGQCEVVPVTCPDGEICDDATGDCVGCTADCTDRACGDDGCGGTCGTCDDGDVCTSDVCSDGACESVAITGCCEAAADCDDGDACTEDACVENQCANEQITGCCATDADCDDDDLCTTESCVEGSCVIAPGLPCPDGETCNPATGECVGGCTSNDECAAGVCFEGMCVTDCMGVPYEGCCAGNVAWYCNTESGVLEAFECGTGEAAEYPNCGWTGPDYGYFCQAEPPTAEPGGTFPLECSAYTVCATVDCGEGEVCDPNTGGCVPDPNAICADMPFEGCCEGEVVVWCEGAGRQEADCTQNDPAGFCGWDGENGFFNCMETDVAPPAEVSDVCPGGCVDDAECDDGSLCTDDTCLNGRCQNAAIAGCCESVADCADADPCTEEACEGNECSVTAIPDCECTAALCDDANVCTTDSCDADGMCAHQRVANCCVADAECDDGNTCTEDACTSNACVHTDIPECQQPCAASADCQDADVCTNDMCVEGVCQHTGIAGCCTSDADCGNADLCTLDVCVNNVCNHPIKTCDGGLVCNPANGNCEEPCVPVCANKVCGDNGCGGSCGACPAGYRCSDRGDECIDDCSCIGMQCGSPGPGCEECGQCAAGEVCNTFFQCVEGTTPPPVDTTGGGGTDTTGGTDTGGGGGAVPVDGGGGGCAATPTGAPNAPFGLVLLLALFGVGTLRRRTSRVRR